MCNLKKNSNENVLRQTREKGKKVLFKVRHNQNLMTRYGTNDKIGESYSFL
jgi:hypothetical protein